MIHRNGTDSQPGFPKFSGTGLAWRFLIKSGVAAKVAATPPSPRGESDAFIASLHRTRLFVLADPATRASPPPLRTSTKSFRFRLALAASFSRLQDDIPKCRGAGIPDGRKMR